MMTPVVEPSFLSRLNTLIHNCVVNLLNIPEGDPTPIIQTKDLVRPHGIVIPNEEGCIRTLTTLQCVKEGMRYCVEATIPVAEYGHPVSPNYQRSIGYVAESIARELVARWEAAQESSEEDADLLTVFSFEPALYHLKSGKAVRRACWTEGTFVTLVPGSVITVAEGRPLADVLPVGKFLNYGAHFDMVSGDLMFPWALSVENILAEDWTLLK